MKSVTFSQLLLVLSIGFLTMTSSSHAREYYKYVDANGVTTYSATPPPVKRQDPQLDPNRKNPATATTTQQSTTVQPNAATKTPTTTVKAPAATAKVAVKTTAPTVLTPSAAAAPDMLYAIKKCNGVRCWDTKGKSFSLVAGNTYLSKTGSKCTKTKNTMRCSK